MSKIIRATCRACSAGFNLGTIDGTVAAVALRLASRAGCPQCGSFETQIEGAGNSEDARIIAPLDVVTADAIVDTIFRHLDSPEAHARGKSQAGFARLIERNRSQITKLRQKRRRIKIEEVLIAESYLGLRLLPAAVRSYFEPEAAA